MKTFDMIFDM